MQRIYCISGLAADHRLFMNLSVAHYELVVLPWAAYDKSDDMRSYARKMAVLITDENPIIIGLSFGGMLAIEMAHEHPEWKIFLISSAKTRSELGYNSRLLKWLSKIEAVPTPFFKIPNFITMLSLGACTNAEKKLIRQIIKDSDAAFMRWSINTLLHWKNDSYPPDITHIHGTTDRVIRSANVHPNYWIAGGSHIMIYNRAAEVSKIISDCLAS